MEAKERYLTKTRFKLGYECPTKLYYTGKEKFVNNKLDDEFLLALAKGGFQVGELAKLYYQGGKAIDELDYDTALAKTDKLLQNENVIIFEAAFCYNNLFIRADILEKKGNYVKLIEVKAKSIDDADSFLTANGKGIMASWEPYLIDVAFQKYVVENAYPSFKIEAGLMLADKSKKTTVEGLNQKFFLYKEKGRQKVRVDGNTDKASLGEPILTYKNVDEVVEIIYQLEYDVNGKKGTFYDLIAFLGVTYLKDSLVYSQLGKKCGDCEFSATDEQIKAGQASGYHLCWKKQAKFQGDDFKTPHVNEIWDFRKKDEYIGSGKYFQRDLDRTDLEGKKPSKSDGVRLSRIDRQELQITKSKNNDPTQFLNKAPLKQEINDFTFPLHFIDFETSAVAIPFNKGIRPYEQIAFQYSHHIVQENGAIEHKGEWINAQPGYFPNFDFIRNLKRELDKDSGTIFRYAAHENTILNFIYNQLKGSTESDREELCDFIKSITKSTSSQAEKWEGVRNMVDMRELVLKYYYHPLTKGSNSIKAVLPAVLNESKFLKEKYSKPIYGEQIKSLNFKNHQWIKFTPQGEVISPYDQLPSVFDGVSLEQLDKLVSEEDVEIHDGGGAMIAYAQMQFTQMTDEERKHITSALLKYCELDTMAMVMIYEAWQNWCA